MKSATSIRRWAARGGAAAFTAVALFAGISAAVTGAAQASAKPSPGTQHVTGHLYPVAGHRDYAAACAKATAGHAACLALVRTNVTARRRAAHPDAIPAGVGYGPITACRARTCCRRRRRAAGRRSRSWTPSTTRTRPPTWPPTGRRRACPPAAPAASRVVNQNGAASPLPASAGTTGWDVEESLDLDMVSAICPLCHIILVEASSAEHAGPRHRGQQRGEPGRQVRLQQLRRPGVGVRLNLGHRVLQPPGRGGDRLGRRQRLRRRPTRPPRRTSSRSAAPR